MKVEVVLEIRKDLGKVLSTYEGTDSFEWIMNDIIYNGYRPKEILKSAEGGWTIWVVEN